MATSDELFIADGYTQSKSLAAIPGLHPDLVIIYRPAIAKERLAYRAKGANADPAVLDQHEVDLVAKYVVSINGQELRDKDKIARLKPAVRQYAIDLVLGWAPADEARDSKN